MEEKNEIIKVEYSQPKFWHRVVANLVDIIIFVFLFFTFFLITRVIVNNNDSFKSLLNRVEETRLDSGLYINTDDGAFVVTDYVQSYADTTAKQKKNTAKNAIDKFFSYLEENGENNAISSIREDYENICLKTYYNGISYFVKDSGGNIVVNEECAADDLAYYQNVYAPFINDTCLGYLVSYVPHYYADIKAMSDVFFFIEIPVGLLFGAVLTYLVPPIFFKRGRKTLGKALYHIGLVNKECLNVSFTRYLVRFLIFFFGEIVLSLFSFGLPFIISFTMMAFSNKRQGFPDYMLSLTEIDHSKNKIYLDKVEALLDHDAAHKKPVDFQMEKPL